MITLPTNLSMSDWTDQVCLDLDKYGVVGKLLDEDWQSWAIQLSNNVSIGNTVPNPYQFDDWQIWGQRLCEVLR